jgi:general secretion pathway protein H
MRCGGPHRTLRPIPSCRGRRGAEGGFTLLEIVVVMVIIAAAAVLGVMALNGGSERVQLHSSTKQIAANLRYTRSQAIATGVPQSFTIDPRGHVWRGPNGRHGTIPEALGIRFIGARQVQPQAGVGAIMFFDDGASTGGRVQITGKRAAWNVDVAWLTGEVSLHRAGARQ